MGAHTGSHGALAASLREHWFKECMADSNTAGNMERTPRDDVPRDGGSEQFFLARKRLIDRRLHRLDSTPRRRSVNVDGASVATGAARCRCARGALRSRSRSFAMLSAAITAMRSTPQVLAGVADLAHAAVEELDRREQLRALVFLARDLVVAPEDVHVELHACARRRARPSWRVIRKASARSARRAARRPAARARTSRDCARRRRPGRGAATSFAARSARVCAISDASFCSSWARSVSMGISLRCGINIGGARAVRQPCARPVRRSAGGRPSPAARSAPRRSRVLPARPASAASRCRPRAP